MTLLEEIGGLIDEFFNRVGLLPNFIEVNAHGKFLLAKFFAENDMGLDKSQVLGMKIEYKPANKDVFKLIYRTQEGKNA